MWDGRYHCSWSSLGKSILMLENHIEYFKKNQWFSYERLFYVHRKCLDYWNWSKIKINHYFRWAFFLQRCNYGRFKNIWERTINKRSYLSNALGIPPNIHKTFPVIYLLLFFLTLIIFYQIQKTILLWNPWYQLLLAQLLDKGRMFDLLYLIFICWETKSSVMFTKNLLNLTFAAKFSSWRPFLWRFVIGNIPPISRVFNNMEHLGENYKSAWRGETSVQTNYNCTSINNIWKFV